MIISIVIFIALIALLLYEFVNFDRLVKIEYQKHSEDWIKDGKPKGFFWRPPESPWVGGSFALQRISFVWLFRTPKWTSNDAEATTYLKRSRQLTLIFNIGIVVWFIITMAIIT